MTRTAILVALALALGAVGLVAVAPAASAATECSKLVETNCWKYGEGFCQQYVGLTDTCLIWT